MGAIFCNDEGISRLFTFLHIHTVTVPLCRGIEHGLYISATYRHSQDPDLIGETTLKNRLLFQRNGARISICQRLFFHRKLLQLNVEGQTTIMRSPASVVKPNCLHSLFILLTKEGKARQQIPTENIVAYTVSHVSDYCPLGSVYILYSTVTHR